MRNSHGNPARLESTNPCSAVAAAIKHALGRRRDGTPPSEEEIRAAFFGLVLLATARALEKKGCCASCEGERGR